MRLILQVVEEGKVTLSGTNLDNKIGQGLLIYVGFSKEVDQEKINKAVEKILKLKIFSDGTKNFKKNIKEINGEILIISNFTLISTYKKNKPDFRNAAKFDMAKKIYNMFINKLREKYDKEKIKTGFFGKDMKIDTKLKGPLNFIIEL